MRTLIISDGRANIEALQALKEPSDHLLCLGDLVDYGPSPRVAGKSSGVKRRVVQATARVPAGARPVP